jgi:predicted permease
MFWKRRKQREDDLAREIQAHLDLEAEERGDANSARRNFGNVTLVRETTRETWGWTWLERLAQDVRYAARLLRKNPGFSAVAVLSLGLGIGANTAIFGMIDALLLKLLPVQDPQELLFLAKQAEGGVDPAFYYESYQRLRHDQPFFRELAAFAPVRLNVTVDGESESTMGQLVSGNYYAVLGVPPAAGRVFTAEDDRVPGGHPVAMISYPYWQRRFGGAPSAIGRKVMIDGTPFTIAGVTPPGFYGLEVGAAPDVSVPVMMQPLVMPDKESWLVRSGNTVDWLSVFGRLKPGVTQAQASAGMPLVYRRIQTQLGAELGGKEAWLKEWVEARLVLVPGGAGLSGLRRQFARPLFVLMGVVGLVLAIACANVANLLLARAAARRREIALRLAIGATRGRLIRQLLVESLVLSGLGGALGIAFAWWGSQVLVRFLSTGRSLIRLDLAPDWRVLAFTAGVSAATGILFGIAPAMRAAGFDLTPALKEGGRSASPQQRFTKVLAIAQVAFSLVLLIGAGLLVRTLRKVDGIDGGFPRERVYTVALSPRGSDQKNGPNGARLHRLYLDLLARVRSIPGVATASLSGLPPTMQLQPRLFMTEDGRQFRGSWTPVYPDYFATLGTALAQGRDFTSNDLAAGSPFVAVVNETLARRVFAGEKPLGKRIVCNGRNTCEVIGVVRDVPYSTLKRQPESTVYMTFLQAPTGRGQMELVVRFAGDPAGIAAQLRREVAAIDPQLPAFVIRTLAVEVDAALIRERLLALLSTVFGGLAVLLAGIGLYGVISYSVGRRAQEIGVRLALGALPSELRRLVLRETLALAGLGILAGLPAALAATRLIAGYLYGANGADPLVLAASVAFLLTIGLIAGYVPARRASRIDPMTALRHE